MQWLAQESQPLGLFLQEHVPFAVALGIVAAMPILALIFGLFNRPAKAAAKLQSTLQDLEEKQPDQVKLLWDYALHSDNLFNDRQNFFLFFESILLGGTFALIAATTQIDSHVLNLVLMLVAFSGLLITVSWWYLQLRQAYVLECMTRFHKIVTPVYRDVILPIREKPYRVGTNLILVNIFPLLVALLWSAILLYV